MLPTQSFAGTRDCCLLRLRTGRGLHRAAGHQLPVIRDMNAKCWKAMNDRHCHFFGLAGIDGVPVARRQADTDGAGVKVLQKPPASVSESRRRAGLRCRVDSAGHRVARLAVRGCASGRCTEILGRRDYLLPPHCPRNIACSRLKALKDLCCGQAGEP